MARGSGRPSRKWPFLINLNALGYGEPRMLLHRTPLRVGPAAYVEMADKASTFQVGRRNKPPSTGRLLDRAAAIRKRTS